MSSYHVQEMRSAMSAYHQTVKAAHERVNSIRKDYGEEAAQRELERQQKTLDTARSDAQRAIRLAHEHGVADVKRWAQLNGNDLTEDTKLLDAGLVGPEEFDALKSKYRDNYTMTQALRRYADARNNEHMQKAHEAGRFEIGGPYQTGDMPTPERKVETWGRLRDGALNMLDMIDGTSGDRWSRALHEATGFTSIERFGEGADV